MIKNNRIIASVLVICLSAMACNMPSGAQATEAPAGDATLTFTPIGAETQTPTPTPTPIAIATTCSPLITTTTDSNVRSGPGQVYNIIGVIPLGGTAPVVGKNFDGTWWYIEFAGSHGWISGSITTATCIPNTLAVIAAPPTPTSPPTNTPAPTSTPTPTGVPTSTPTPTPTLSIIIPSFPTISIPCIFC